MFLQLNHQKLQVYSASRDLVREAYRLTRMLPLEEKFGMVSQIRRAALSVHLNIAEGSSRMSMTERRRYFEMARGSVIEIDAALDIAKALTYVTQMHIQKLGERILECFKLLTGLIKSSE